MITHIPEEFVIIGAALQRVGNSVALKKRVTSQEVKDYMNKLNTPIEYYEDEYKFCKLDSEGTWVIEGSPPLSPPIVQLLLNATI